MLQLKLINDFYETKFISYWDLIRIVNLWSDFKIIGSCNYWWSSAFYLNAKRFFQMHLYNNYFFSVDIGL